MQQRIASIKESVENVCSKYGIPSGSVSILAATKTVSSERINELPACGITLAAENRVQEFVDKRDKVQGITWDFIGALQTNKVKFVVGNTRLIHSLDRQALADEIERLSAKQGIITDALIEVNMGEEENKSGVMPTELNSLYEYCLGKEHIRLRGIMPVLPIAADECLYDKAYELFAKYKTDVFDTLSMGMSGDYLTAIKHGANLVRLGSIIFGKRT